MAERPLAPQPPVLQAVKSPWRCLIASIDIISGYDMIKPEKVDYGLEYLIAFDGRVHTFEDGCWVKFEIKKGGGNQGTTARPILLIHASCA